jgi:hypothetical protein
MNVHAKGILAIIDDFRFRGRSAGIAIPVLSIRRHLSHPFSKESHRNDRFKGKTFYLTLLTRNTVEIHIHHDGSQRKQRN